MSTSEQSATVEWTAERLGPHVVQHSPLAGRTYPRGGPLVVTGSDSSLCLDAGVGWIGGGVATDGFALSHFHEDHVVGVGGSGSPVWIHEADAAAVGSWDGYVAASGLGGDEWKETLRDEFAWTPIASWTPLVSGCGIDLGGVRVVPIHLPGHTPGHCGFLVEPDGVLYLGDVDLSGFGPYYGDKSADLSQWRTSLRQLKEVEASVYATFHHKGPVYGTDAFRAQLRPYAEVLDRRTERAAAAVVARGTNSPDALVGAGIIYRVGTLPSWGVQAEKRMIEMHLTELGICSI